MEVYAQFDFTCSGAFPEQEYLWKINISNEHNIESNIEQNTSIITCPLLKDGYIIRHLITDGVCILDYRLINKKDALLKIRVIEDCVLMEFLLGGTCCDNFLKTNSKGISGRHGLHFLKGDMKLYHLNNNSSWDSFLIFMSKDFYYNLIGKTNSLHNDLINTIYKGCKVQEDIEIVKFHLPLNFDMQNVIGQVRNCTRTGKLHRLCLEIKIRELLLLQFEQYQSMIVDSTPKKYLHVNDIERIKSAKIILEESYNTPPTIQVLAKMIGINEHKLKKGFKELFGVTIHEYVTKYRMEKGNQMVKEQNLQIREVAIELGYKNPSHFSAAFKKHFGFLPTEMIG